MPSTPSALLKLELQQKGENLSVWGDKLNALFGQTEEAIASALTLTITGDRTLTADQYMSNEYRRMALVLTGSPSAAFAITVPAVSKSYWIANLTAQAATIKPASGTGATVRVGQITFIICDGTKCTAVDPTLDQIAKPSAAVNFNGQKGTGAADGSAATDLATVGQVANTVAPYATAAANSASAANTSAGNASTSATNAANSATASANSATASANSATASSNSATAAQNAIGSVKVSSGDTTPGNLTAKLIAGSNITLTKGNAGANETLTVAAAVAGAAPWVQIASIPVSGTPAAITFSAIPQTYQDLLVQGLDFQMSATATLQIAVSADGTNYSTAASTFTNIATGFNVNVLGEVINYVKDVSKLHMVGATTAALASPGAVTGSASAVTNSGILRSAGGLKNIRFSPSTGTFTSGTFLLFAR